MIKNKKAANNAVWILILIVISVIIGIVIIAGFTMGWGDFLETLTGQKSTYITQAEIKAARNVCNADCSAEDYRGYCAEKFLNLANKVTKVPPRCWQNPIYDKCTFYDVNQEKEITINTLWCEENYPEVFNTPDCIGNEDCVNSRAYGEGYVCIDGECVEETSEV